MNLGTIESRRQHAEIDGANGGIVLLLRLCREQARGHQRQGDAGQDYKEAEQNTEIKEG